MRSHFLFPNAFKIPALTVFILSIILLILQADETFSPTLDITVFAVSKTGILSGDNNVSFGWITDDIYGESVDILFIISGLVLAFSKQKVEDEMIAGLRLKSLVRTTFLIYILLIFSIIFLYGMSFLPVVMFFFYAFLIFFNLSFYINLYIHNKTFSDEN